VNNDLEETVFGFRWGPVTVERCVSDPKWGVQLSLTTERWTLEVRIMPTGRLRLGVPKRRAK
jgi:hypothetical protein